VGSLTHRLSDEQHQIGLDLILEIQQRLGFLRNVGCIISTRPPCHLRCLAAKVNAFALPARSAVDGGVLYILDEPDWPAQAITALLDTLIHLATSATNRDGG
jgi:hypothetical protein